MLEDFKRSLSIARRTTESSIFVCLFLVVWVFFNEKKIQKSDLIFCVQESPVRCLCCATSYFGTCFSPVMLDSFKCSPFGINIQLPRL